MKLQQDVQGVSIEREKIHIGLVLAGAVTAGAYTAGVLDYFLNTMDLWEKEYAKNPGEVAQPNVIIDAITGASAGSIVAAVTVMALASNRYDNVENPDNPEASKNILFDTWVNLGLEPHESMTEKLFSTSDLENGHVKSMLNTSFIGDMIEKLMKDWDSCPKDKMPKYINPDLKILMTLSNLRGVPLKLSFSNGDGVIAHTMSYHKAFAYFKLGKQPDDPDKTTFRLDLTKPEDVRLLLECSRASGAFPIGLKSVAFPTVSKEYIEANLLEIFKGAKVTPDIDEEYQFLAVDGGMTNNEPIAEAMRILDNRTLSIPLDKRCNDILNGEEGAAYTAEQKIAEIKKALEKEKRANKPIIMIDPFPNFSFESNAKEPYKLNDGLFQVVPQLYETLRNQVLFKESDIADLFSNDSQKGMIWPTRRKDGKKYRNAIASAALGGFAGFFNRQFLQHDYMLGQKNCQRFLRNYFYQDYEHSDWPQAMKDKFDFVSDDDKRSLPIIPDYRIESYDKEKKVFSPEVKVPDFPKVDYEDLILKDLRPKIARRVTAILDKFDEELKNKTKPAKESEKPGIENRDAKVNTTEHPWLIKSKPFNQWLRNSWLGRFFIGMIFKIGKRWINGQLNRWITNQIILDMSKHGLFEGDKHEPDNELK